jgi:hypothetical protein
MADLDTRSKRSSSVQLVTPFLLAPVLPDGTIDQGDRQQTAWTYSGIAAGGAAPPATPDVNEWIVRARRRGRR